MVGEGCNIDGGDVTRRPVVGLYVQHPLLFWHVRLNSHAPLLMLPVSC